MLFSNRTPPHAFFFRSSILLPLFVCFATPFHAAAQQTPAWIDMAGPAPLNYDEIERVAANRQNIGRLQDKLNRLFQTPFVASYAGPPRAAPHAGSVLRITEWNIERGLELDSIRSLLEDRPAYLQRIAPRISTDKEALARLNTQIDLLQTSDLLVLNEVDLGMPRTGYRPVASELARTFHMNYLYGVEFLELEGIAPGSILPDPAKASNTKDRRERAGRINIDRARYQGLHGNAIFTRFPITHAEILPLPVCYDWYDGEKKPPSKLERGKRFLATTVFAEDINQEIRAGGRMALIADLAVPRSPTGHITAVDVHLEDKCKPSCRRKQMDAVLQHISTIGNPIVIAGDLNTNNTDGRPISLLHLVRRRVEDWQFWAKILLKYTIAPPSIYLDILNYYRNYQDPTGINIPVFFSNREHGLFRDLKRRKFPNGERIDFRGTGPVLPYSRNSTLGNSNERGSKAFKPSYLLPRTYGGVVGRFRLDWILVKPFITNPKKPRQSFLFAPGNPQTLSDLNGAGDDELSDHIPITVDLYLREPNPGNR